MGAVRNEVIKGFRWLETSLIRDDLGLLNSGARKDNFHCFPSSSEILSFLPREVRS